MRIRSSCYPVLWLGCFAMLSLAAAPVTAQSNRVSAGDQDQTLKSLYDAQEWFRLRDAAQKSGSSNFYRGAVAAAFNDLTRAEKYLRLAISRTAPGSDEAHDARLLLTQIYMRAGLYQRALNEVDAALKSKPDDGNLKNVQALLRSLSNVPAQTVASRRLTRVHYAMNDGNLFLPVTVNGKTGNYLLDTGANYSLISESEAKRLGLTITGSRDAKMGDSSGANIGFRLAVADTLAVGNLRLRHVVFLVMRDDQQPFAELPGGQRGIIGFPVILAFQTMRWNQKGIFEIGFAPGERKLAAANMYFSGQKIMAEGEFDKRKIDLFVDTGSIHSRALPRFAHEFSDFTRELGTKSSQRVTGVGNSIEVDSLTLPRLPLTIHGQEIVLGPVSVLLKETASDLEQCHVWIGIDFLNQASSVTFDFNAMTIVLGEAAGR